MSPRRRKIKRMRLFYSRLKRELISGRSAVTSLREICAKLRESR